tara:strand:- start:7 stop:1026 length:1020 start_codon:yes stop_codon:yes gene_type:complete
MGDGKRALHDKAEIVSVLCCLMETLSGCLRGFLQDELKEEPTPLVGGPEASVYRFQAASSEVPQVLRILQSRQSAVSLKRMKTILEALTFAGVKTPQLQRICDDETVFGGVAAVMDFVEGSPLEFGNIRHGQLLGELHAELHSRDVSPVIEVLEARGLPRDQWLSPYTIDQAFFRWSQDHPWLQPVITWMDENFDLDQDLSICHGDFHPDKIRVRNHDLVGILDWTFGIAPAVFDVGFTLTWMEILTRDLPLQCSKESRRAHAEAYLHAYCQASGLQRSQIRRHQVFSAVHFLLGSLYTEIAALQGPAMVGDLLSMIETTTGLQLSVPGQERRTAQTRL